MRRFEAPRVKAGLLGALLGLSIPGLAQAAALDKPLQPLGFLLGAWEASIPAGTAGHVHGVSSIIAAADGHVLVRNDRNEAFDKAGNLTHGFGQFMTIYADRGGVCADYVDGDGHVIHYGPATIVEGQSVEFTSATSAGAPVFRLRYDADGAKGLKIWFGLKPPGKDAFSPIATGEIYRVK
jgi:hypothetical protein